MRSDNQRSGFGFTGMTREGMRLAGVVAASAALGTAVAVPVIATPAFAAVGCPTGSVEVATGICEVVFTETPSSAWTPPASITQLSALLVGAGGAGAGWYGGGGGDVQLVELTPTGDVSVTVGTPGTSSGYGSGNDTVVTQGSNTTTAAGGYSGGSDGDYGGTSGSGIEATGRGGSGAGSNSNTIDGGDGLVVNELTGASSTLFAADDTCLGGGGGGHLGLDNGLAVCGGGSAPLVVTSASQEGTLPLANSGGGGASWYDTETKDQDGAAGKVVLRFNAVALPDTGARDLTAVGWTAAGLFALGGGAIAVALRAGKRRHATDNVD